MKNEHTSLYEIRRAGIEALSHALGPLGMIRFLSIYETGLGDYTGERGKWLDKYTLRDIVTEITDKENPAP